MIPDYKKILFATDLSKRAQEVFEHALRIAAMNDAVIVILHVIDQSSPTAGNLLRDFIGEEKWKELKKTQENRSAQALMGKQRNAPVIRDGLRKLYGGAETKRPESSQGRDEVVIAWGNAADEILMEAKDRDCDLIVLGHTPRGAFSEAMMGSTTKSVVRRSKKPVLVVPVSE